MSDGRVTLCVPVCVCVCVCVCARARARVHAYVCDARVSSPADGRGLYGEVSPSPP